MSKGESKTFQYTPPSPPRLHKGQRQLFPIKHSRTFGLIYGDIKRIDFVRNRLGKHYLVIIYMSAVIGRQDSFYFFNRRLRWL